VIRTKVRVITNNGLNHGPAASFYMLLQCACAAPFHSKARARRVFGRLRAQFGKMENFVMALKFC
jgi:hypothetical protein